MGREQNLSSFLSFWNPDAVSVAVGANWVSVPDRASAGRSISRKAEAGPRMAKRIYKAGSHIKTKGRSLSLRLANRASVVPVNNRDRNGIAIESPPIRRLPDPSLSKGPPGGGAGRVGRRSGQIYNTMSICNTRCDAKFGSLVKNSE